MRKSLPALVIVLGLALPAVAATLAGVTLPDTVTVGGQTLLLNGMGVRTKVFVKVYVGGLYLEKKTSDAAAIIKLDAPKRVVLHFVYSEVGRDKMVESFSEGFQANAPEKLKTIKTQIDQFLAALEPMKKGDELTVTYTPATGTVLELRGKEKLTIPGQDFGRAVFSVWFGPKPPTNDLKSGLLGKKT